MKMLTNSAASAKKRAKRKQKPTIEPESERACFQSDPQKTNVYTRHFVPENISCHSVAFKCSLFSNKQQNPIEPFERMKNCSVSFENSRSSQRKLSVFVEHSLAWWCSATRELSLLERQLIGFFFFQKLIFFEESIDCTSRNKCILHAQTSQSRAAIEISLVWTEAGPWFFYWAGKQRVNSTSCLSVEWQICSFSIHTCLFWNENMALLLERSGKLNSSSCSSEVGGK